MSLVWNIIWVITIVLFSMWFLFDIFSGIKRQLKRPIVPPSPPFPNQCNKQIQQPCTDNKIENRNEPNCGMPLLHPEISLRSNNQEAENSTDQGKQPLHIEHSVTYTTKEGIYTVKKENGK